MDRFWIVFGNKEIVDQRLGSRKAAEEKACRMATENAGVTFAVMECVSAFKAPG